MAIDLTGYGSASPAAPSDDAGMTDVNPFDALSTDEFEELQLAAEQASLEVGETPAEEAAETDEEQAAEAAAGTEMHSPQDMAEIAASAFEEASGIVEQMRELVEEADENDDSDPKAIAKLLDEAEEMLADAEEAKGMAEGAVGDEDVGAAAEGAAEAERVCEELKAKLEEAKSLVGTPPPASEEGEGEEAPASAAEGAAKALPPKKDKPKPALSIWASRD